MQHEMIKIKEDSESITQKCEICGKEISFSKIFEPKTLGELPENYYQYLDPCEEIKS